MRVLPDKFIELLDNSGFNKHNDNEYIYIGEYRFIKLVFINNSGVYDIHVTIETLEKTINLRLFSNDSIKLEALLITSLYVD